MRATILDSEPYRIYKAVGHMQTYHAAAILPSLLQLIWAQLALPLKWHQSLRKER